MEKVLIAGDTAITGALSKVLGLLASYELVCISLNPSDTETYVDRLESYKDKNVTAIILASFHGVEIAKHIRLTDTVGKLSLRPLIVLTPEPAVHVLKSRTDNVFLLSPECYLVSVSSCIEVLLKVLGEAKGFASDEEMRNAVKPFVVWSDEDGIVSRHDNFNRYGPFKLLKEHFGLLPEPLSRLHESMTKRLWFKKYRFLEHASMPVVAPLKFDNEDFKKVISNKKTLYVDDEHRLGWSFVLHSILSGNCEEVNLSAFEGLEHLILSPDGRLTCVDSYSEAESLVVEYEERLSSALSKYSDLEARKNDLEKRHTNLTQELKVTESAYRKAKESAERLEVDLKKADNELNRVRDELKNAVHGLAETYIGLPGEPEVDTMSGNLQDLNESYEQWSKKIKSETRIRGDLNACRKKLEECQDSYERNKRENEDIQTEKDGVRKKYDDVVRELDPRNLFPYDMIILDLRLEKEKDRNASAGEISGIRLLRKIKKVDPGIPVIVFTASEKAINYKAAKELGASGYWIKAVNTAADLKGEITESMCMAEETRPLWYDIRKVEAKKQLLYVHEDYIGGKPYLKEWVMDGPAKNKVVSLLKESFLLRLRELSPFEESVCNYNNYSKIVLNMGLIQEERYKGIKEKRWDMLVTQKAIDRDEAFIRRKRNNVAHSDPNVSIEDAMKVLRITLKKCLAQKLL